MKIQENKSLDGALPKYSFNGGKGLAQRRFVLNVVTDYFKKHPNVSFEGLKSVFPQEPHDGPETIIRKQDRTNDRWFLKKDEVITLTDGTEVCVSTEWVETKTDLFAKRARELGYAITKIKANK